MPYANFHSETMSDILLQVTGRQADYDEAGFDLFLSQLGSEGWEMMQVREGFDSETSISDMKIYFKRRIR